MGALLAQYVAIAERELDIYGKSIPGECFGDHSEGSVPIFKFVANSQILLYLLQHRPLLTLIGEAARVGLQSGQPRVEPVETVVNTAKLQLDSIVAVLGLW